MNRLLTAVLIVNFGFTARTSAGEKPPAEAEVRRAIERSLPFVEKDGVAWIQRRDCMSCHVVTFMLWAHNEAKAHGRSRVMRVEGRTLGEVATFADEKTSRVTEDR